MTWVGGGPAVFYNRSWLLSALVLRLRFESPLPQSGGSAMPRLTWDDMKRNYCILVFRCPPSDLDQTSRRSSGTVASLTPKASMDVFQYIVPTACTRTEF